MIDTNIHNSLDEWEVLNDESHKDQLLQGRYYKLVDYNTGVVRIGKWHLFSGISIDYFCFTIGEFNYTYREEFKGNGWYITSNAGNIANGWGYPDDTDDPINFSLIQGPLSIVEYTVTNND